MANSKGAGAVCEYGTVNAFLDALFQQSPGEVLLAPAYRSTGASSVQVGALLSGQRFGDTSRVHTCTVLGVEAILLGERGRIIYPYRSPEPESDIRPRIAQLQQGLLDALLVALQGDARVARVSYPASYQATVTMWTRNALTEFPLGWSDGRWTVLPGSRQNP